MLHRLEVRSKAANVAEVNVEKVRGSIKTPEVVNWSTIWSGGIYGPPPKRGLRGMIIRRHFDKIFSECVRVKCVWSSVSRKRGMSLESRLQLLSCVYETQRETLKKTTGRVYGEMQHFPILPKAFLGVTSSLRQGSTTSSYEYKYEYKVTLSPQLWIRIFYNSIHEFIHEYFLYIFIEVSSMHDSVFR